MDYSCNYLIKIIFIVAHHKSGLKFYFIRHVRPILIEIFNYDNENFTINARSFIPHCVICLEYIILTEHTFLGNIYIGKMEEIFKKHI